MSLQLPEEHQIIKNAKEGDEKAWQAIYSFYYPKIESFARYNYLSIDSARDIAQHTLIKFWQNIKSYQWRDHGIGAWLFLTAKRLIIDLQRTQNKYVSIIDKENLLYVKSDKLNIKIDSILALENILKKLSAEQRELLFLRYSEDLDYSEMSKILNKSEVSLRKSMSRLLAKLRLK